VLSGRVDRADARGVATGIADLDDIIGGWQIGQASVVAARPGMGKSSFGITAANSASSAGVGVHVFSLEDTRAAYCDRVLARESRIAVGALQAGQYSHDDMRRLTVAMNQLDKRPWLVNDASGMSAEEIVRSVRKNAPSNRTQVVIVDYLQILKHRRAGSRHEAIGDSLNTLADAARNDGMAYVVMSQLNREVEKREGGVPRLSDLRDSGSIEERPKLVLALHRDQSDPDGVQVLILKNSQGEANKSVRARWHGPTTRLW